MTDTPENQRSGPSRRRVDRLRRTATGALASWAVIATVGIAALVVQVGQNRKALRDSVAAQHRARLAVEKADLAAAAAGTALIQISAETKGLCVAIDSSRVYVDAAHQALHALLGAYGHQAATAARQQLHSPKAAKGVRRAGLLELRAGQRLARAAASIWYLAPVDCAALSAAPLTYVSPVPQPFGSPGAPR